MNDLRQIEITEKISGAVAKRGKFHRWYVKGYEDGSTFLYAIVELESGKIETFKIDDYSIKFTDSADDIDINDVLRS